MDDKGLLRWARNEELVDTVDELWRDSGKGTGIEKFTSHDEDVRPAVVRRTSFDVATFDVDEVNSVEIPSSPSHDGESGTQTKSVTSWVKKNVTPTGVAKKLIRRTIRNSTWIYVAVSCLLWLMLSDYCNAYAPG